MIEKFFDGGRFYDTTSFEVAVYSLLLAFVLSTIMAVTYQLTSKEHKKFPGYFFQAMVLSAIVTCMIMMAVGSNLAVGFGIIGAVAVIRFRTVIQNPRNIIFMFGAISVGIATGVYGYAIAMAGVLIFCVVAFLFAYSPYRSRSNVSYELTLNIRKPIDNWDRLFLTEWDYQLLTQKRVPEGDSRWVFVLDVPVSVDQYQLYAHFEKFEEIGEFRIEASDANTRL